MAALVDSAQMQATQYSSTSGVLSLALPPSNSLPSSLQGIPVADSISLQQAGSAAPHTVTVQGYSSSLTPSTDSSFVSAAKRHSSSHNGHGGGSFTPHSFQAQHQQAGLGSVLHEQPQLAEGSNFS